MFLDLLPRLRIFFSIKTLKVEEPGLQSYHDTEFLHNYHCHPNHQPSTTLRSLYNRKLNTQGEA